MIQNQVFGGGGGEVLVIFESLRRVKILWRRLSVQLDYKPAWGGVCHPLRVTDYSHLAYSLSRKGSSKNGMRITIKMN